MLDDIAKRVKLELEEITPEDCKSDPKKREQFHFNQLCEKQPIGKHMFAEFCKTADKKIKDVFLLTQAIRNYEASYPSLYSQCHTEACNEWRDPSPWFSTLAT